MWHFVCLCVYGLMHEADTKPATRISSPPAVEKSAVSCRRTCIVISPPKPVARMNTQTGQDIHSERESY